MTEQECLDKMIAPGTPRAGKYRSGVIQIWVTRACDKACFGCTQGSNLGGKPEFITVDQFRQACRSLKGYFGVVGMFGGNPAMHPEFDVLCSIMRSEVPADQRGIWCNNPISRYNAETMRKTFDPKISNLNVHLDRAAYDLFKAGWPESMPCGLDRDSRHSPPFVAMKDVVLKDITTPGVQDDLQKLFDAAGIGDQVRMLPQLVPDDSRIWELISGCDINQHWSAMVGVFRGQLRAWFCEVAGAQAMLHQDEPDYPDTGLDPMKDYHLPDYQGLRTPTHRWWELPMSDFVHQVRKHCFDCGVPLRSFGELAQAADSVGVEQVSLTHAGVYKLKRKDRKVQVTARLEELGIGRLSKMTDYLGNSRR